QHANRVVVQVRDGQVELSIFIEICHDYRERRIPCSQGAAGRTGSVHERTIGLAQIHHDGVARESGGPGVRNREIQSTVAVEIPSHNRYWRIYRRIVGPSEDVALTRRALS